MSITQLYYCIKNHNETAQNESTHKTELSFTQDFFKESCVVGVYSSVSSSSGEVPPQLLSHELLISP